jgi:hypothetical protein
LNFKDFFGFTPSLKFTPPIYSRCQKFFPLAYFDCRGTAGCALKAGAIRLRRQPVQLDRVRINFDHGAAALAIFFDVHII